MGEPPIRLVVRDAELRRDATVFLRILLAIPHLIWVSLWGIAAYFVAFVNWLAVVIQREVPEGMHGFVAGFLRYATHVSAYVFVVTDGYPGFRGAPGYEVDLEIDPPRLQSRWSGFFRLVLALPAFALAGALGSGLTLGAFGGGSYGVAALYFSAGAAVAASFLTWCVAVTTGRAPRGLRDLMIYAIGYGAQTAGYAMLLTPRYPNSDPALATTYAVLPEHPVQLNVDDDLGRSRLTVLFRLLLAIPHFIWWMLWAAAVTIACVVAWIVALVTGRVPDALHRFFAAFVRYTTHLGGFVYLVGRRFPGFTGGAGSYGIDVEVAPRTRQSRWKTLLRLVLALPALIMSSALGGVVLVIALLAWWYALVSGRMPEGFRNLGASCLRYSAQTAAYLLLVTDRYPYAAPVLREADLEPAVAPLPAFAPAPVAGDTF